MALKIFEGVPISENKFHEIQESLCKLYQHSDDDPTPFFQYVNMNVLVDQVDDIVADKGIDHNGDKGSHLNYLLFFS
jgi:hypothetical protein